MQKVPIVAIVLLLAVWARQQPDGLELARQVRQAANQQSKVLEYAFYLTDVYGPRLTGTRAFKDAGLWAVEQLRELGLDVHTEAIPWGRSWSVRTFSLELTEPRYGSLLATAVPWSLPTGGPIEADAILAPLPTIDLAAQWRSGVFSELSHEYERFFREYSGKLRGKVVLATAPLRRDPDRVGRRTSDEDLRQQQQEQQKADGSYDPLDELRKDAALRAQMRRLNALQAQLNKYLQSQGVVGVLYSSRGSGGTVRLASGAAWRTQSAQGRDPDFPLAPASAVLSWEHYNRLTRLVNRDISVRLRLLLDADFPADSTAAFNVIADLPGSSGKNDVVLLGAHLDSWTAATGATDNAAGAAVMMEVMRILKAAEVRPKRTIRIALWGGHEGAGLGSRSYIRQHLWRELPLSSLDDWRATTRPEPAHAALSAYYNLDYGSGRIRGIYLQRNAAVGPIFGEWFRLFDGSGEFHLMSGVADGTDNVPFHEIGIPAFQFVQDSSPYGTVTHHSSMDVFDYLIEDDLRQSAAILAYFAVQTAMRDERLPRVEPRSKE